MNFLRDVKITNDSPGTHIHGIRISVPIFDTSLNMDYRGRIVIAEVVSCVFSTRYRPLQALLRTIAFGCLSVTMATAVAV